MKIVILRRSGVGDPFAKNIVIPGHDVVVHNKDDGSPFPSGADVVFRWGTTSNIPDDPKVFNSAKAIHKVYDKGVFRKTLSDEGVAPKSWVDFGNFLDDYGGVMHGSNKVIIRPAHHVRSIDLYCTNDLGETYRAFEKCGKGAYISEYIPKDAEYRVFVVQGRVMAVIRKIPKDKTAISWGCVTQGQFEYVPWSEWPLFATQKAVEAFRLSGLDFGAVDVVSLATGISGGNRAYVLEINTAPELTPYYGKTLGLCLKYMVEKGSDRLDVDGTTWKDYIHPALL